VLKSTAILPASAPITIIVAGKVSQAPLLELVVGEVVGLVRLPAVAALVTLGDAVSAVESRVDLGWPADVSLGPCVEVAPTPSSQVEALLSATPIQVEALLSSTATQVEALLSAPAIQVEAW
jgi:hypothetical protein